VLEAHPEAEVVLLDASAGMLDQARALLGDRARCVEGDLTAPLPAGPWDAIVSGLAIHHLPHAGKRDLYARACDALAPRGVLVNAEQVAGPTALFGDANIAWHEASARALGATTEEWEAAIERMRHDRYATVEEQLGWLRAGGFADADCLFKQRSFAVLAARRAD
jgi:tRNA (cmo5U34)-methyltransferase